MNKSTLQNYIALAVNETHISIQRIGLPFSDIINMIDSCQWVSLILDDFIHEGVLVV